MTKIFVAGATGYIGINVVKSALNQNFEVVAASRKESADFDLRDQNLTVIKITESGQPWRIPATMKKRMLPEAASTHRFRR